MDTNVDEFNQENFAERLKKLRGKDTINVAAKRIEISNSAWSTYENATKVPSAIVIYKLAKLYDVSADYLLGLREPKSTDSTVADFCVYSGLSEEAVNNLHYQVDIRALPPMDDINCICLGDNREIHDLIPDEPFLQNYSWDEEDERDSFILFPYISSLLSLTFTESYLHNLRALEENIEVYCKASKELRKLNQSMSEKKERISRLNKETNYYCEKTNGLMAHYSSVYMVRYKIYRLICERCIPVERLYKYHIRIKELEEELGEIEREIFKIIPSTSIDLDAFCYNEILALEDYNSSVDRLNELRTEKAKALNDIIETLDYLSTK